VQTASVNLNKADHVLLAKALEKEGYSVSRQGNVLVFSKGRVRGTYQGDKLQLQAPKGETIDTDAIKRAYSDQAIQTMAEKYAEEGWEVTKDGDEYVWNHTPGYGAVYA
jgi:hypothetical protein